MSGDDDEFKVLMGRIGSRGGRSDSFVNQVLRAMRKPASKVRRWGGKAARGTATRPSAAAVPRSAAAASLALNVVSSSRPVSSATKAAPSAQRRWRPTSPT